MTDEWYYTNQGQQMGPVSAADLQQMAASQRLQPSDLVWKEGLPKWVPASTTKGLFPESQPSAAAAEQVPMSAAAPVARIVDDDEARPRRRPRRDEDDDYEARPRRRPAKAGGMGVGLILLIVGGIAFVVIAGVAVVVVVVLANSSQSYSVNLSPMQQNVTTVRWNAGQRVEVTVTSDRQDTDVDLWVLDEMGREVAADRDISADCHVSFIAPRTGNYRIVVYNLGPFSNRSYVRHN